MLLSQADQAASNRGKRVKCKRGPQRGCTYTQLRRTPQAEKLHAFEEFAVKMIGMVERHGATHSDVRYVEALYKLLREHVNAQAVRLAG